jgi:hypothetical protein
VGRAEYDAGVKALADGKTRMEGAKNRGEEEPDYSGGRASVVRVADHYDWLLGRWNACKAALKGYEAAWEAIKDFDKQKTAQTQRSSGWAHAFTPKQKADLGALAQMRGLLGEMRGLSAQAPARLEGRGEGWMAAAHETWNTSLGMTSARYVYDACWELIGQGGAQHGWNGQPAAAARLAPAVLAGLQALQKELKEADDIECLEFSGKDKTAKLQALESTIRDVYAAQLEALKQVVARLVPTTGLAWQQARGELSTNTKKGRALANDAFAVALSEFLTAIHSYLRRHGKTQGVE